MNGRVLAVALFAFLGMVDTLYISFSHRSGPVPCHVTRGCNDVLTSAYSEVAGIPISWFGLVFYVGVFSCAVFEGFGSAKSLGWIFWPALFAFGVSVVLTGIQVFVLRAYCEYCLASATFSTAIFLLSLRPFSRHTPLE